MKKKSKPNFNVLNAGVKKRVKHRWRKPRGIDNKKRIRRADFGKSPRVGYKNPSALRGTHPLGVKEYMVCNLKELLILSNSKPAQKEKFAVRIKGAVNKRNKEAIRKKSGELKIRVLN